MSDQLRELGEILKKTREEKNLSLKEVENNTSIRSTYLEAIEEGCIDQYIAAVYALGFIKQYASFLGLDIKHLALDKPGTFCLQREKHDFSYGIGTMEMRGPLSGGVKWLPNILWAGLSAALLIAVWYFAKYMEIF